MSDGEHTPHPYATIEDALAVVEQEARWLPPRALSSVCPYCFGAKKIEYGQCYGCLQLLRAGASRALLARTIPVSIATTPGPWYSRLAQYKTAAPDNMYLLAAAAYKMISRFESQIEGLLGGEIDCICITPSKRGRSFEEQRLRRAIALVGDLLPPIEGLLAHRAERPLAHQGFDPSAFHGDADRIAGRRILLVEDLWVSGSTVVSVATQLQDLGAAAVVTMPIARKFEPQATLQTMGKDCSYLPAVEGARWRADDLRWPLADYDT